ncbi:MAG: GWxTD domain-containing protein [Bacteroidetes bacterium]|nr:GWxTD domain-containing protein [Bacteroidota bacterium]
MKRYLIIASLTLILFSNSLFAVNVTAYLTFANFTTPANEPYFETYLSVIGNSIKFIKNANDKYQGAVDITVAFKQKGEIKNAKKYTLSSPEVTDTTAGFPNFIDMQRYSLSNGSYELEITIADKNSSKDKMPFSSIIPIVINFSDDKINASDIQLLESYTKSTGPSVLTKSGYDLLPYVSTFFPENSTKIKFYTELYNAKKVLGEGQKLVINYFIQSAISKVKLEDYSSFSKQTANEVNVILAEFDIKKLPSGNYNLIVEVRDKDNKIQAEQKCPIQRKNKLGALSFDDLKSIDVSKTFVHNYTNIDTLADYIRSLKPISGSSEIQFSENELKGRNLELMQQYFYNFWKSRNELEPEITWLNYGVEVLKVNKEFGTFNLKGYNSDRGRVYLQYGPPSLRSKYDTDRNSPVPYEVWQYNTLVDRAQALTNPSNRQSNRKFIFGNPDVVTNRYLLFHSDAQGEIYDANWLEKIGGNSEENFLTPR